MMKMNEQLDRLKDVFMNNLRSGYSNIITDADFSWLIKQAERVEELRKINKWLEDGWDTEIKIRQISDERMGKLFEQNQRYKQALRFYADEENWTEPSRQQVMMDGDPDIVDGPPWAIEDSGEKARQALGTDKP